MAEYRVIEPTREHALALAKNLRDGDRRELTVAKVSSARAVWRCFRHSLFRRAMIVDGEVGAMWGLGSSILSTEGEVWMLTSPAIEKIKFAFVREGFRQTEQMLSIYPKLTGIVHCDYYQAIKFLQVLGFSLQPGDPFYIFSMER